MELIAIPSGLAGCKRKIEFDRCRWERKDERKNEREENAWLPRCDRHDELIGCIHALFVGKEKEDSKEGREGEGGEGTGFSHRKEGRKETELFATGNRIN